MQAPKVQSLSVRYTTLSDRFRSLWTFYQFLGGVLKHLDQGSLPYTYDFQALHERLKEIVHAIGVESTVDATPELDQLERELDRIHRELTRIESQFAPSVMRKFFDHIKRQDEKILCALLKFYLLSNHFEQDTLDKLDILFTRLAEAATTDGRPAPKDSDELLANFKRLSEFTDLPPLPLAEETPLAEAVRAIRQELESIEDYKTLVESKVYERYRRLKQRLGKTALRPSMLVEITTTNIVAKNRFEELYKTEEGKVIENTNRILDIERYLERHPELASEGLKKQLEEFRTIRVRYEAGARKDNVKRDDIAEMTRAMQAVLAQFDPASKRPLAPDSGESTVSPTARTASHKIQPMDEEETSTEKESAKPPVDETSLDSLLPPDPLLNETLHKIMFALEMIVWNRLPTQITTAPEIRNLNLEPREIETYRRLAEGNVDKATPEWELDRFFLMTAALRVKMEEETSEITRLENANNPDRLYEVLEHSARSLERARDTDRRFQWFIDDMLFRGDTQQLEYIYRCRFRFLHAYSGLWLVHQRSGGLTPL
jgi:hypothetical protein